jgi:hypothetical protein
MDSNCNKEWTRKHIVENFTKTFVSGPWKKNREKVLFDKEKALLPATQAMVQTRIEQDKITQEIKEINDEIKKIKKTYSLLWEKKNRLERQRHLNGGLSQTNNINYVRACPDGDCRGYLNTHWMCGICNNTTCSKCHIIILPGSLHKCNNDDVLTASLLNKDTKPCPKCSTGIFKIDGCDQMWCTLCHTAFSWKTGHIENTVHNPHYFEWVRKNGQQANFGQDQYICGQEINHNVWNHFIRKFNDFNIPSKQIFAVENIVRSLIHFRTTEMHRYRVIADHEDNTELRIKFLRNLITEDEFAKKIQQSNKAHEKKKEVNQVLSLFERIASEIILRLAENTYRWNKTKSKDTPFNDVQSATDEINGIILYTNTALTNIKNTYNTVHKNIIIHDYRSSTQRRLRDIVCDVH